MPINDRFKKIRQHFGLSQAQFAQKIKRHPGFISNVEHARSDVSEETIKATCMAFGINEEWLASGKGDMFEKGSEVGEVNKESVGERIRGIRKERGLTQQGFGQITGYSKAQVYSVEVNKVTPSNDFIRKVACSFGINYNWLMTGVGDKKAVEAEVDEELIEWLRKNPDVVVELKIRSGRK